MQVLSHPLEHHHHAHTSAGMISPTGHAPTVMRGWLPKTPAVVQRVYQRLKSGLGWHRASSNRASDPGSTTG
eukprot:CAMPEP_0119110382 /NCGR_PEP_ID=MMETSP1180-20130426/29294_1 /TAXON_ID=3052 ORGANISM="Chlamydomonas cf sp, Strain CCMP681" /NCGR_SAMPLE_ID=MMETSP1180 /ASSEMBLY_ACC=CAM_ASM_000741 /LENGTH=71 /DNA_ID=CAMNT_0007096697 /DNA_START=77 /DNA_END=288 /DNA_ORIENTATION=+